MSEKNSGPNRQEQFRRMAAQMQTLSPQAIDKLKHELRRRAVFAIVGGIVIGLGAWMNPNHLGVPVYTSTIVMIIGAAIALLGMLGLARGIGCMAYVTAFFWLMGLTCGLSSSQPVTLYILAGTACVFALAAVFMPKKKHRSSGLDELTLTMDRPGISSSESKGKSGKAKDRVIDINAKEISKD